MPHLPSRRHAPRRVWATGTLAGFLGGLLIGALACSSPDVSTAPTLAPGETFWALTLPSQAITMSLQAPYDTLQLVATPRSALGTPLVGAPAPTFFTTDSGVQVSPTGLLTARTVRSNMRVIAELTYQGVHLADTAVITVTDAMQPHYPAAQLVLQPLAGEGATLPVPTPLSAFYGASGIKRLEAVVQDASGAAMPEALVALTTSAPDAARFTSSPVEARTAVEVNFNQNTSRPGLVVWVYASATVYGATVRDSLALTLTQPRLRTIAVQAQTVLGATPGSTQRVYTATPAVPVTLGVGGTVWWMNSTFGEDLLDVVFDDPTAAVADPVTRDFLGVPGGDGDIAPFGAACDAPECLVRARRFPRAGTFLWHSPATGLAGTIIVQ